MHIVNAIAYGLLVVLAVLGLSWLGPRTGSGPLRPVSGDSPTVSQGH